MSSTIEEKFEQLNKLLDDNDYVLVHLNPKNEDVLLPDHLASNPSVTLKLSRYFKGTVEVSSDSVSAELLFDGEYIPCKIPLKAIWGCTSESGENMIWPESTPEDVLRSILETAQPTTDSKEKSKGQETKKIQKKKLASRGHLKLIK